MFGEARKVVVVKSDTLLIELGGKERLCEPLYDILHFYSLASAGGSTLEISLTFCGG